MSRARCQTLLSLGRTFRQTAAFVRPLVKIPSSGEASQTGLSHSLYDAQMKVNSARWGPRRGRPGSAVTSVHRRGGRREVRLLCHHEEFAVEAAAAGRLRSSPVVFHPLG